MSKRYCDLCIELLGLHFGPIVRHVADCLFSANSRSLLQIIKDTKLAKSEVQEALCVLVKHNLLTFGPSELNENFIEYSIERHEIIWLLYYPSCVEKTKDTFDLACAFAVEEILKEGSLSVTAVLVKCMSRADNKDTFEGYRRAILKLIQNQYIVKLPAVTNSPDNAVAGRYVPELKSDIYTLFTPPDIDLKYASEVLSGHMTMENAKDSQILWKVNFKRYLRDIRDELMIGAIERKMGTSAGECFRHILQQINESSELLKTGTFNFGSLRHAVEKSSCNSELQQYLDLFLKLIVEDKLGFVRRVGDMGGGEYVLDLRQAFDELAMTCIEKIITERFGSKAARVFRVIRTKKFIDQEEVQKEALMSTKEAKSYCYELLTSQFIQVYTLKRATAGQGLHGKGYQFFCVKHNLVVKMVLGNCFKALYNLLKRKAMEVEENGRLLEKGEKLDRLVEALRKSGESEDYITEQIEETVPPPERVILEKARTRLLHLAVARLKVQETMFLCQLYLEYASISTPATAPSAK